jgi:peptidoglycan/xylan/chitin deacetylase (PgdA/CDA1 family)
VDDGALPILMYHGLHADEDGAGVFDPVYSVDPSMFSAQLDWLAQHGFRTLRLRDLESGEPRPPRSVIISFDDGDISNAQIALPQLAARDMVGEFFITADFVGQSDRLSSNDLRDLVAAGMGVQSHGYSHAYLEDLNEQDLEAELVQSKAWIEAVTGQPVIALGLPGGRGGERERQAALAAGYRWLLGSEPGHNHALRTGHYLQRLPITRALSLSAFVELVEWHGVRPRALHARYQVLARMKRLVGNSRYERMRGRLLGR